MQNKLYAKGFGINYDAAKNVDSSAVLQASTSPAATTTEAKSGT